MKMRKIGRTGVEVTEIAFGCASIGNLYRKVSDADAEAVLQTAWDAGIRYFDTAPHYGRGLSETRLGRFLQGRNRSSYALSSKLGRVLSPAPELIAELRAISDAWLGGKTGREKGFSVGRFDADYLAHFDISVVRKDGRIVAFANILASDGGNHLAVDLMRYVPE